jgi:hypothetical protein
MKRSIILLLFLNLIGSHLFADVVPKTYTTQRLTGSIKIDGILDDDAWKNVPLADGFIQLDPTEGNPTVQRTEVRMCYDNTAIYISAMMYDSSPDSVLHELGLRDESDNLNADYFKAAFDTYNNRQDGYVFQVSASGVQSDFKQSDPTYDGIWESAVHIGKDGWSVEIKIPYSAIRFPKKEEQVWAIQFARFMRRNREYDQWTLTPKKSNNRILYWGTVNGINHIEEPLRLSITPYLSLYTERVPLFDGNDNTTLLNYQNTSSYSGGADIKYGIDKRFTLDMTLLPDFSQVQSDNKVKNLSAFETVYNENRPFFKEGVDLFSKGNIFYSRRIQSDHLKNAVKLSGRTDKGLGIGFFNAINSPVYTSPENGSRELLSPLTNSNILVLDQNLAHNCDVFIINTNVMREGNSRDANVTSGQVSYETKNHYLRFTGGYSLSQIFTHDLQPDGTYQKKNSKGTLYSFNIDKVTGNFQGGCFLEAADKRYDKNDLGRNFYKDYISDGFYLNYNKNNPFWNTFKFAQAGFNFNYNQLLSNYAFTSLDLSGYVFGLFNNNYSLNLYVRANPLKGRDYYEPRIPDRFFSTQRSLFESVNASTNYNKLLAFDFGARIYQQPAVNNHSYGCYINPIIRLSNKWSLKMSFSLDEYTNDRGFANVDENSNPIFGQRNITTVENSVNTRYLFKNDMALSVTMRHYWSLGVYTQYFNLLDNGSLQPTDTYSGNSNFNTNFFNVDLSYSWQFSPGSSFIVTYKNQLYRDPYFVSPRELDYNYRDNLDLALKFPQTNSISLKILYYLDYQYVKKKIS